MPAIVEGFSGLGPWVLHFPDQEAYCVNDLKARLNVMIQLPTTEQRITSSSGMLINPGEIFQSKSNQFFRVSLRILGGKGGFGANLKSLGGRLSKKTSSNTDACRDLSGRRIRTVNEAKKRAEFLQSEPEKIRKAEEELVNKIKENSKELSVPKFQDTDFFRQKEHIVDDVKSAVSKALKDSISSKEVAASKRHSSSSTSNSGAREPKKLPTIWDEKVEDEIDSEDEDLDLDFFIPSKSKQKTVKIKK